MFPVHKSEPKSHTPGTRRRWDGNSSTQPVLFQMPPVPTHTFIWSRSVELGRYKNVCRVESAGSP